MSSANRNISLRALRVFCAAAERESFREAAEASFLTSSAVSHQIKQLEAELGVRLFERTPRSLKLTDDGHAFYHDIVPVIADLDTIAAKHSKTEQLLSLRISVQPFFASELFVPRLPEFVEQYPDINISIDTSDETPEKHPGVADVSLRIFKKPPTTLSFDRLFPLRLTPAGSPDFCDSVKLKAGRIIAAARIQTEGMAGVGAFVPHQVA